MHTHFDAQIHSSTVSHFVKNTLKQIHTNHNIITYLSTKLFHMDMGIMPPFQVVPIHLHINKELNAPPISLNWVIYFINSSVTASYKLYSVPPETRTNNLVINTSCLLSGYKGTLNTNYNLCTVYKEYYFFPLKEQSNVTHVC